MNAIATILLWVTMSQLLCFTGIVVASKSMMKFREDWMKSNASDIVWNDNKRANIELLIISDYHISKYGVSRIEPIYRYYNITAVAVVLLHLIAVIGTIFIAFNPILLIGYMMGITGAVLASTQFIRFSIYVRLLDSTLRIYRQSQERLVEQLYVLGYTVQYDEGAFYFANSHGYKTTASLSRDTAIDIAVKELYINLTGR